LIVASVTRVGDDVHIDLRVRGELMYQVLRRKKHEELVYALFATQEDAERHIEAVARARDPKGHSRGKYSIVEFEPDYTSVVLTFTVSNAYEYYDTIDYTVTNAVVPAREPDEDPDDWAYKQLYQEFTGVGHPSGDSWYDIEILESSDPTLVGQKFDWGY
jgi:hypothetical protein